MNHHFYINLFVSIAILDIRVIQGRLEAADLPQNQDVTQTPLTTGMICIKKYKRMYKNKSVLLHSSNAITLGPHKSQAPRVI